MKRRCTVAKSACGDWKRKIGWSSVFPRFYFSKVVPFYRLRNSSILLIRLVDRRRRKWWNWIRIEPNTCRKITGKKLFGKRTAANVQTPSGWQKRKKFDLRLKMKKVLVQLKRLRIRKRSRRADEAKVAIFCRDCCHSLAKKKSPPKKIEFRDSVPKQPIF